MSHAWPLISQLQRISPPSDTFWRTQTQIHAWSSHLFLFFLFFLFFWGWSTEGWSRIAPGSHPFVEKLECKWSYIIDAGWKGSKWKQVPITGGCMLGPITVRLTFFKVKSIHQNIISLFFFINKSQASLCFLFPRRISGANDVCTPRVIPLRMMEWHGKVCRVEYHWYTEEEEICACCARLSLAQVTRALQEQSSPSGVTRLVLDIKIQDGWNVFCLNYGQLCFEYLEGLILQRIVWKGLQWEFFGPIICQIHFSIVF